MEHLNKSGSNKNTDLIASPNKPIFVFHEKHKNNEKKGTYAEK